MYKIITIPKSLNKAYQEHLELEIIQVTRAISVLGCLLFFSSIALDFWAIPSCVVEGIILRSVVIGLFLINFAATFHESFCKYYNLVAILGYLSPAFAISFMLFLSSPNELAYYTYFSALIVLILMMCLWSYLNLKLLLATIATILIFYVLSVIGHSESGLFRLDEVLVTTLFLLVASVLIGLIGRFIRDSKNKQNFLLKHSLNEAIFRLKKEADNHEYHSNHDQLTGLANRRYAERCMAEKLDDIELDNQILTLLFLDLNGFKLINDEYGHDAGDEVLRIVASRIKLISQTSDLVIRLGGDEFLIGTLLDKNNSKYIEHIKKEIKEIVCLPIEYKEHMLRVSVSIGVSKYPADGQDTETLIKAADQNMYEDKLVSQNSFIL